MMLMSHPHCGDSWHLGFITFSVMLYLHVSLQISKDHLSSVQKQTLQNFSSNWATFELCTLG